MRELTLKCLQAKWYNKLEKLGFKDIEKSSSLPNLDYRNATVRDREAIEIYFTTAERHLFRAHFPNPLEKHIWELHTRGLSLTQIKESLKVKRSYVYGVICRHRERAGLKRRT